MAKSFIKKMFSLNGNQLKMIALISMIIDHVGFYIFEDDIRLLRIIGRIALPIYAYLIAEGCMHTKNRKKYLGIIAAMAFVFQVVFWIVQHSLYQGILVTFTISIVIIYSLDTMFKSKKLSTVLLSVLGLIAALFVAIGCPRIFEDQGFDIDYGLWGILLPVLIYFAHNKKFRLVVLTVFIVFMSIFSSPLQWWALLSIPFIALYNGERGSKKLKYFFYIAYPLHLVLVFGIKILLDMFNIL